ncbi:MAG: type II secretion system protein GspG [Planctomycetes bacterium]|nr:type II secretion system protein GspG [Planctomycetota bacterium]
MSVDEENTDTRPPRQAKIGCIGWAALFVIAVSLVTWVVPNQMDLVTYSAKECARRDIAEITRALDAFAADHAGKFPRTLVELVLPDANGHRHLTPLQVPRDPWKNEYHYEPPSAGSSELLPHVWSYGKDGQPGGDDDIDSRALEDG